MNYEVHRESQTEVQPPFHVLEQRAPRTILLAEDDTEFRELLAARMRREGYHVIEADSGHDLLDKLGHMFLDENSTLVPDLIISDERMPGLSGTETLYLLQDQVWMPPVIIITGYGGEDIKRRARKLGVASVLFKPVDFDEVVGVCEAYAPP